MNLDQTTLAHTEPLRRFDLGPPPRPRRWGPLAVVAIALALVAGALLRFAKSPASPPVPTTGSARSTPQVAPAVASPPAFEALPPLAESDPIARELVGDLGAHPQLTRWLASNDLVRRFVSSVINVAEGTTPAKHVPFMAPSGTFHAREENGRWVADPTSFDRYDVYAAVLESLEPERTAALYRRLHPLLDLAYAELGDPRSSFDATLARAIDRLVAVKVPAEPPELVPSEGNFVYADPALETASAAERQLLRMGPDNARRVQERLRLLSSALALPSD